MKDLTTQPNRIPSASVDSGQGGGDRVPSAFMSTYNNEYMGTLGPPAPNARVRTSQFYPSGRSYLSSTYQTEYVNFPLNKNKVVPYGSSSGYRKNNPHPHNMVSAFRHPNRDYFVWSHYQRLPPLCGPEGSTDSQNLLRQVCQDKIRSIYQEDFLTPPYATDATRPGARTASGITSRSSLNQ